MSSEGAPSDVKPEPITAIGNRLVLLSEQASAQFPAPPAEPTREYVEALYAELERTRAVLMEVKEEQQSEMRQRVKNETALRMSEMRYRAFVEQSTEAIWCFELDRPVPLSLSHEEQLRHLYHHAFLAECNDATARMYGYDRAEDMKGRRLTQLLPTTERLNVESMRGFVRNDYRVAESETRENDRHGRLRYFRNNRVGIVENGLLRRWWGTQRDVTALVEAEERREESEKRLRMALSAADMGTWDWELGTGKLQCSPELNRIFGLEEKESYGSQLAHSQFIVQEDRADVRRSVFLAVREGMEWECEFRIRRLDGTVRWLLVRGDLTRDHAGCATHMVGAATDITDRRQAESEREHIERKMQDAQKLESLGILAGGIAHDFNNLLTGIIGNANLAMLGDMSAARMRMHEITNIAQRAADLCQQMLAYAGKGRFCVSPMDLSALIRNTTALVQLSISKQANIIFDLAPALPPVLADSTQLSQIVINLVMNASDALGPGGGRIILKTGIFTAKRGDFHDARTCPEEPEGDYVMLEVSDTGCGMSADTLSRIFDPFFTTKFTGRGLGLAAVIGIVRAHRGALFVNSAPGRGTVFRVLLPQARGAVIPDLPDDQLDTEFRGGGTVLVVEDESMVRGIALALIQAAGFTTVEAWSGLQSLEIFKRDPGHYAAVLLDVTMPGIDGIEVFSRMRAVRRDVPVVLMSGYSELEIASRCHDLTRTAFLQKPFTNDSLLKKLRSVLPNKV